MGEIFFPGDNYLTPEGKKQFWQSIFSYTWLMLYSRKIVKESGMMAKAGNYSGEDWSRASFESVQSMEALGIRLHVDGMDNMDKVDGPCVFVANHMSTMETAILPVFIQPRKDTTFVVKESLMNYTWFQWILRARQAIVIRRENPREDFNIVMTEGVERLSRGMSVIVFPQGTRQTSFSTSGFNSIGIKLAKRAGVPIIPIALRSDALGMGKIVKDLGRIRAEIPARFRFGEPVRVDGNGKDEHTRICEFMADTLRSWGVPVLD